MLFILTYFDICYVEVHLFIIVVISYDLA